MRALVVGGDSKIGRVLCDQLAHLRIDFVRTTRDREKADRAPHDWAYLDLLDPQLPRPEYPGPSPDVIYIMAAITGVVPAEKHPDAWRVNAEAPVALALQASKLGMHVVFMSSGTVEFASHTASAMQKRYAEAIVHVLGGCVVRPLPVVPPEKYVEIADILIEIGEHRRTGVVRWEG